VESLTYRLINHVLESVAIYFSKLYKKKKTYAPVVQVYKLNREVFFLEMMHLVFFFFFKE